MTAVARFISPEAADEFRKWAQLASDAGMKIKWIGDGEERDSEEQA